MSADWAFASFFTRALTLARSTPTRGSWADPSPRTTPSSRDSAAIVITSAVAISVLDGTQSVSTADPPSPSRSTTTTSAPSWAATSAAS
jgi:hypothetical protein